AEQRRREYQLPRRPLEATLIIMRSRGRGRFRGRGRRRHSGTGERGYAVSVDQQSGVSSVCLEKCREILRAQKKCQKLVNGQGCSREVAAGDFIPTDEDQTDVAVGDFIPTDEDQTDVAAGDCILTDEDQTDVAAGDCILTDEDQTDVAVGDFIPTDEDQTDVAAGEFIPTDEDQTDVAAGGFIPPDEDQTDVAAGGFIPLDEDQTDVAAGGFILPDEDQTDVDSIGTKESDDQDVKACSRAGGYESEMYDSSGDEWKPELHTREGFASRVLCVLDTVALAERLMEGKREFENVTVMLIRLMKGNKLFLISSDDQDMKTCSRAGGYESEMYDSSGDERKPEKEKCAASSDEQDAKTCSRAGGYESEMYNSSGDEWKPEKEKCAASTSGDSDSDTKDEKWSRPNYTCAPSGFSIFAKNKKAPRQRRQNPQSKRCRNRFRCPIEGCTGFVTNLKRHFEQVHIQIPTFEAEKIIKDSRGKCKRSYPVYECSEKGCSWKGTRPDKHLVSKAHKYEKHEAKRIAKNLKWAQSVKPNKPALGKNMHTASSLSESFLEWYQSIEGGHFVDSFTDEGKRAEKVKQNKKCQSMVCTVLQTFFGDGPFHKSALESLDMIGRPQRGEKSVVEKLKEGRTWGTVKNYLCAFSHFIVFLEVSKPELVDKTFIPAMKANLKGCLQSVTRFALDEMQHRKIDDRDRVVSFELITQYLKMNVAQTLSESFHVEAEDSDEEIRGNVHRMSMHIMLELALPNGKRAGIFNQMTCSEVRNATPEQDGFVILVAEGKTFRVSGAAGVYCTKSEYQRLCSYMKKNRPLLKPSTEQVFCRRSGDRASVSETGDFLKQAWTDFGTMIMKDVGDMTFTLIRKTLVSKSRKEGVSRETQQDMARHMDHTVGTADKSYDTSTGSKLTARFRQTFNKFHDSVSSDEESFDDGLADVVQSSHFFQDCAQSCAPLCDDLLKSSSPTNLLSRNRAARTKTFGKNDVFTVEDKGRLHRCCSALITKYQSSTCGRGVTRKEILEQIKSAGPNFRDLLKTYTIAQICNRVRCEIRKK
ncbi:hypothetical protein BaRGS_00028196, partial [Batillaria attramentaria]